MGGVAVARLGRTPCGARGLPVRHKPPRLNHLARQTWHRQWPHWGVQIRCRPLYVSVGIDSLQDGHSNTFDEAALSSPPPPTGALGDFAASSAPFSAAARSSADTEAAAAGVGALR